MTIDPRLHRIVAAQPYPLLFATISGAHRYGFQSPDSDYDLRGAHVLPLKQVVGLDDTNESCQFSPDGGTLIINRSINDKGSQLYAASISEPGKRAMLAAFDGPAYVQSQITTTTGTIRVVTERISNARGTISTSDPQRLWLVGNNEKREVVAPAGVTNWFTGIYCLSPDGRYLALGSWEKQANGKRARVIHLIDLESGQWKKFDVPATSLELVGWTENPATGVVLSGLGFKKGEVRYAYSLNPVSATLTPLPEIPRGFATDRHLSPDGKLALTVKEHEKCEIADTRTGQSREFVFHPYDRRNVYRDSVQWASNRYLVFQGLRTALIDIESLKMNFPTSKESRIDSLAFSPYFKFALGRRNGGTYLGRVILPE